MTRLMLGTNYDEPTLLVEVEKEENGSFHFWVINGAWDGKFVYNEPMSLGCGDVFINRTEEWVRDIMILCDNQDRLRGDYQDVFINFEDENYVAPKPKVVKLPEDWDDDIAF